MARGRMIHRSLYLRSTCWVIGRRSELKAAGVQREGRPYTRTGPERELEGDMYVDIKVVLWRGSGSTGRGTRRDVSDMLSSTPTAVHS